jgi:chaperonin cofactor prefoldin
MSATEDLDPRVGALEVDVAELRRQLAELHEAVRALRDEISGMEPPAGPMGTSPPFAPP